MNVNIKINGRSLSVDGGLTVLRAAELAGIHIPTLCHIKGLHEESSCRVCLVETRDRGLVTACDTKVYEGMEVLTDSENARRARRANLELMCENHRMDCDNCGRYTDCEFHELCSHAGINSDSYELFRLEPKPDRSPCIVRDSSKCVLCRRCVSACARQGLGLISALFRGPLSEVGTALPLSESGCIGCGQCLAVCPTAALMPCDESEGLWVKLLKKERPLVAIVAPAAAKMLGEAYHDPIGGSDPSKLPALLRKLGFDAVYSAELFVPAYNEALRREAEERGTVISAHCPGIVSYIEKHAPDLGSLLSAVPSPTAMLCGALHREAGSCDIVYVGACTALKARAGDLGLSAVLTVSELAAMLDRACVSRASAVKLWRSCAAGDWDVLSAPAPVSAPLSCREIDGLGKFIENSASFTENCGIIKACSCIGGCVNGGGQYRLKSAALSAEDQLRR